MSPQPSGPSSNRTASDSKDTKPKTDPKSNAVNAKSGDKPDSDNTLHSDEHHPRVRTTTARVRTIESPPGEPYNDDVPNAHTKKPHG